MKRAIFLGILLACLARLPASAEEIKKQVFFGAGAGFPKTGHTALPAGGGFSLVVPISTSVYFRPVIGGGAVVAKRTFSAQTVGLLGLKAQKIIPLRFLERTLFLGGGGVTALFQHGKPGVFLPTAVFSTAIRISRHWSLLTPYAFNRKGGTISFQAAFSW